jgi:hypothetical protein
MAHDSTQAVFRKVRHVRLLSFGNAIRLNNQLYRYSLMAREKGKRNADPTPCENDSRPNLILVHTISRDPHEKKLFKKDQYSFHLFYAPWMLISFRRA